MDVLVRVVNQRLKIATNLQTIIDGTQEFIRFVFDLSSDWDDLVTVAQFTQDGVSYNQLLDKENSAYLPSEIGAGTCTLMLYGNNGTTRGTTNYLTLIIDHNILVADAQSTEITQSLYDQLIERVNELISWNDDAAAELVATDEDLQRQINLKADAADLDTLTATDEYLQRAIELKADSDDLTAEITRAMAAEAANATAIAGKASQADVDALAAAMEGLENNEVVANMIETAVATEMDEFLNSGQLANLTIEDGSLTRDKVDSDFESTLANADTAMQPSVYDPQGIESDVFGYAENLADAVQDNLDDLVAEVQDAYTLSGTNVYTSLGDAIRGAVTISNSHAQSLIDNFDAFSIEIVDELPQEGDPMTFYLIPNSTGDGYDKFWWITDEDNNTSGWDSFGSATTLVVNNLPLTGVEDIDYILNANGNCLFYKWIDSEWRIVGGSIAEVVSVLPQSGNEYTDYYILNADGRYSHYRWVTDEFVQIGSDDLTEEQLSTIAELIGDEITSVGEDIEALESRVGANETSIGTLNSGLVSANNNITALGTRVTSNETNIVSLGNAVNNLQQDVNNIDVEGVTYYATYDTDNVFTLYEVDDNVETVKSQFTITGGGGGGGQAATNMVVERITPSPVVATPTDKIEIRFSFYSTDSDGQDVDGSYTWKLGNTTISSGALVQGINTFDMTDYCNVGTQKFTLTVTDEGGSVNVKTWTVQIVDVRIESSFSDRITYPYGGTVNFTYTPYGSVVKTVHFILDGVELPSVTTSASGTLQSYPLPAQSHGAHLLECFMTATVNSVSVETSHIYKDIVWYNPESNIPVIGCIYRNNYYHVIADPIDSLLDEYYILDNGVYRKAPYKEVANPVADDLDKYYELSSGSYVRTHDSNINLSKTYYLKQVTSGVSYYSKKIYALQYDTTNIQYHVFDPNTNMPTITRTADGSSTTQVLTTSADIWAYKSSTTGTRDLVIACGPTSVTITMNVSELDIDVAPVTANLAFDFNPTGLSNTAANRLWHDTNNSNIAMSVSNNFDWSNGGYQLDADGNQYFCVKAGTTATFSYNLFATDPKTQGMEFKLIFKTTNVKRADAGFFSCVDGYAGSNVGLQMNTHEAYLRSSSDELYIPYSEDDKIEFEFNINPLDQENVDATSVIMSYEDGVGMRPMIYDNAHRLYQYTPTPITIGSTNCDVHIYRMKAYTSSLTDSDILMNFIADAPDAGEMLSRYNRNQIYDENNNLTPESLAAACPDLKVIKIECPQFTNNKSNFVKYTNVQCIHKNGDPVLDNWTFTNCYHSGQGTTSNEYGYSGRNIDIVCCMDGVNQYSSKITFDPDYKTTLTLGDGTRFENGTGKVSLSRTSVPNNWFNIKVNIASSENANNALLQKRYNDYLPYTPAAKARDPLAKNDMEFFNCVVFVKETGNSNGTPVSRREFTDSEWHFYAIGNIGDSKKTDSTRVNDPDDMKEFCIEISDNTLPNAAFQTGVYAEYTAVAQPTVSNLGSYYDMDGGIYKPTADTSIVSGKTYYTRGSANYSGTGTMIYPITEAQWNNANNVKRVNLAYSFDGDDTDDYAASFEFRYDMGGETRDGDTTGLSSAEQDAQRERNKQIFRDFYKWVITSSNSDFVSQLPGWFVQESALYWYLFTERYTMIDNRSKNTFWHFGDIGVYRPVPMPNSMFMDYYYEKTGEDTYVLTADASVNSGKTYYWKYAFEMWDYDNDTALGINNSGELTMQYGKEDVDFRTEGEASSGYIFNAADNVFWRRIRLLMNSQLRAMYQTLDSSNCWSSTSLINEYDAWQSQFPEELWRLDIERKYYRTYRGEGLNAGETPSPTPRYLQEMMNGRKKYQRRQFERDQAAYMGTKYLSSSIMADKIEFRCNTPLSAVVTPNYDLTITPYSDMYLSVKFGNTNPVQIRAKAGTSYNVECPIVGNMDDTMFVIYCASRIQALNDISACYIHDNDFSGASRLQTLVIGNTTPGYQNLFLTTLNLGSAPLLESLDIRNCPNLTGSLNLSSCVSLITLRADGTALTAVTFANYGNIATAYLPPTINTLTMRNLHHLTNLNVSYDNLESLTVETSDINEYAIVLDAADTLQYLRLVGIDWTVSDTTLLNTILAMNTSYLSGSVFISGQIRNKELEDYGNAWSDLEVTYNNGNLVEQYQVTYKNADGTTLYTTYVDRGMYPPDPVTLGLISTPTMASTAQYTFTYSGWDGIDSVVLFARTITATYTSTVRSYTVNWYSRAGLLLETTTADYGSEVNYSGATPTDTSREGEYVFSLFNGWDKSTGYITGDTDVYAVWDTASLPSTDKDLEDMTCAEVYAVCNSGLAANYFVDKDYIDIQLGGDFTFSNVQSQTLVENRFFDGVDDYYDTNIKLFDEDSPSFTIAIDYEYIETCPNGGTLVSCYEENGSEGFRLRYSQSSPVKSIVSWGDRSLTINYATIRNIIVFRHVKGSKSLYSYVFNYTTSSGTAYDLSPTVIEMVRSRETLTDQTLTFGAVKFSDGGHDYYGAGWVHWCKIWYADLGDIAAKKLVSFPHETLRMEFAGVNRYRLAGSVSARANGFFIANNGLALLRQMNSSSTNEGGWAATEMRTFLNTRVLEALPYNWQNAIKTVRVPSAAGNYSSEIIFSEDKLYLPAYVEVGGTTQEPYASEGERISFFTNNASRVKFPGIIIAEDAQIITSSTDPSGMVSTPVKDGDVWVAEASGIYSAFIYLSADTRSKHSQIGPLQLSSNNNIAATDGRGLWLRTTWWFQRTPYVNNYSIFQAVSSYGSAGSGYGATSSSMVVVCFSV